MNEYEQERNERIVRNKAKLRSLGILEAIEACRTLPVKPKKQRTQGAPHPPAQARQYIPRKAKEKAFDRIQLCVKEDTRPLDVLLGLSKRVLSRVMTRDVSPKAQWVAVLSRLDLIQNLGLAEDLAAILEEAGLRPSSLQQMENAVDLTLEVVDWKVKEQPQHKLIEASLRKQFNMLGDFQQRTKLDLF